MNLKRNLFLPLLFGVSILFGQSSMTLEAAIKYAYEHNSTIKNALINIADAEGLIDENRAIGLPKLSANGNYTFFPKLPTTQLPAQFLDPTAPEGEFASVVFGLKQNFDASLNLDWLALDGTYFYGLQAAKLYRDLEAQNLLVAQKNVRDQITEAYLPALIISENVSILEKNIANLEKILAETRAMYKEGFMERLDVARLELSLSNLQNEKDNLTRQQQIVLNALKFQMGFPINQQITVTDNIDQLFVKAVPEELTSSIDFNQRPETDAARLNIELNQLNIKRYKAGYLPTLRLNAAYQQTWQGDKFNEGVWFPTTLVGANLSVPIFDGFQKKANIERANLALERAKLQETDLQRSITLEVENARTSYLNAQRSLDNQTATLTLAEQIYNDATIKYQEGVGSSLELNQAEQDLYAAQRNRIQALYDLLIAKTDLGQAFGK